MLTENLIEKVDELRFAANFYQSIIAIRNLDELLDTAGSFLEGEIKGAKIIFFLRQGESFSVFSSKYPEKENER